MNQVVKLLRELIALPSVNPAFASTADGGRQLLQDYAGENKVGEFVSAVAARSGLDVEFQEVLPTRFNVLARLSPTRRPRQRILLAPHLDTVGVAHPDAFVPRLKNGRIHGRGACDTKGSVAAMLSAVCEVAKMKQRPAETEIIFAGLIDEENAQAGSRALAKSVFKADLAIVGEPTCLQVVTAHKGSLWLELETRGKSAHGAMPHLGQNAVHEMARIVDLLQTLYAQSLKKRRHPLLGHPTVSVGVICGGTQANIVPNQCTITVDRRTLPGETESTVHREIMQFLRSRNLDARIKDTKLAPCVPMETDPAIPLIKQFMQCVGQRKSVGTHFFCDAAVLSEGGIPSVVFGPGDIAQAHTADEWISVAQLERAKDMLVGFLRSVP
jgi:acetylornithine deacetylase/succinyl-diaminopimelate desuccinylase-like protein